MTAPLVWQLHGPKAGDNRQLAVLATELQRRFGWRTETRALRFRRTELLTNLLLGPTLSGLSPTDSDYLEPPWPDIILTAGRRNEPVARWIKQTAPSPVAIVHVGRPWARLDRFDLIVTTRQYFLTPGANIQTVALPLQAPSPAQIVEQEALQQIWTDPGRLRCGVLIGGNSGKTRFTAARMRRLVAILAHWREHNDAALTLITSPRTPAAAVGALRSACASQPHTRLLCWQPAASDSPYQAILASAHRLVVTAESASMLAEAANTGAPLAIADVTLLSSSAADWLTWPAMTYRMAQAVGPRRLRRNVGRLSAMLMAANRAQALKPDRPLQFPESGADRVPAESASEPRLSIRGQTAADLIAVTDRIHALAT